MNVRGLAYALALTATQAVAEVRDQHLVLGNLQGWISVVEPIEILTIGPNEYDRIQVLSGADLEIVATAVDPQSVAMVGAPVLVASVTGSQTCEDLSAEPLDYYVIPLSPIPTPEGPVTSCGALTVSITQGEILLADPMAGDGPSTVWSPKTGFGTALP